MSFYAIIHGEVFWTERGVAELLQGKRDKQVNWLSDQLERPLRQLRQ